MNKKNNRNNKWVPLKVALIYAAFSALWILLSDQILFFLVKNPSFMTQIQMLKGWIFITISALIIFLLLRAEVLKHSQSEAVLMKSERNYRLLADNATDVIFVLDMNLNYTYVSPSVKLLRGYEPEEVIGQSASEALTSSSWQLATEAFAKIMALKKEGNDKIKVGKTLELEVKRKNGQTVWTEVKLSFIWDEQDEPAGILGVTRDINKRKLAEAEREELHIRLAQAQKMEAVGRLAGGVAHDFNNMLTIILGNADIMLEDLEPSSLVVNNLNEIQTAARRSSSLTKQLLAFARKQTIEPKIINLNAAIEGMMNMLSRLIGEDIDLSWQPGPDLRPVKINPTQVDQILANLCVNAKDSIKGIGGITIETGKARLNETDCQGHPGCESGDYVFISVSDNGSGMDKETLENLFEPFFTTKEVGEGTGLGLATVYGIVKQNNGFINVCSELKNGTTFKIYLPGHENEAGQDSEAEQDALIPKGNETILLVEDETAILKITKKMLRRMGYTVLTASSPVEAIKICDQAGPGEIQLLMTDVVMPEMNGRDLAENLLQSHPDLKCLYMSGYTANVMALHNILDNGLFFINKPFSKQDLSRMLREILDGE